VAPWSNRSRMSEVPQVKNSTRCRTPAAHAGRDTTLLMAANASLVLQEPLQTSQPPGFFADTMGSEDCIRCPAGSWSEEMASSKCETCPLSLTTRSEASTSAIACLCLADNFWPCLRDGDQNCVAGLSSEDYDTALQCTSCPAGMTCDGGTSTVNATTEHA
jgi:hypothetical protein